MFCHTAHFDTPPTHTQRHTQSHQTKEDLITKPRISPSPLNIIGILSHTPLSFPPNYHDQTVVYEE